MTSLTVPRMALLIVSVGATAWPATISRALEPPVFKAGTHAITINPKALPVESAGSMTPRLVGAVHDDLHARCLVLDDGQTKIALVVCDSCMIPRELFDAAKELASKQTGIPTDHILCSATHTHTAVSVTPVFQSGVESEYVEFLQKQIALGIATAHSQLQPAKIGWAVGNAPQYVFNRRWFMQSQIVHSDPFEHGTDRVRMNPPVGHKDLLKPAGPTDPEVSVLAVQSLTGEPIALWANYSLHYVGGVPGDTLSADYFGEFSRQIVQLLKTGDQQSPMVAAMTNGTSGNINNVNFFERTGVQRPFEQIRVVASEIARAAHVAYQRIEFREWAELVMREIEIELGVRKPDESEIARAKELLAEAGPAPWSDVRHIYAGETLDLVEYPDTVQVKLQAIRIGELGIATSPCETFVETGLALKQASPLKPTFTIELANGYNGYLPTPEHHALGGYETWRAKSSYLAEDAEPKVRDALLGLLDEVASGVKVSATDHDQGGNDNPEIEDTLSRIRSTQGGRHWVDSPTDPPKSPEESLASFELEPGLRIELVAAEPLVMDPVWIAFDEFGRMFVAEYADYPLGPAHPDDPPLSRIVMLEDTDGDGRMDRRHVFADNLNFAHSVMPFRDGLLVGAKNEILYLKDTDGDHRADVREVLFRGFTPPHPQMQIGCPQWGIDNWIYFNYGPGQVQRLATSLQTQSDRHDTPPADSPIAVIPNKDFRFHSVSYEYGPASGFGQFGNTIDAWGNRLFCNNRNPIMAAPISYGYLSRNPFITIVTDQYDVAPSGGDAVVYPLVEMKSNYLSHAGTYTSACGTTAYLGGLLGPAFENSVFVSEPIGHLIARYIVGPAGAALTAERARENAEFLASTDTWFRPVSLASGPDGALYLADMYRLWVEHPKFLPPEVAQRLDWRAGEDRGRIWRVVPESLEARPPAFQPAQTNQDLIDMLSDSNGWRRQLAQRLLVERQARWAAPALRRLIEDDRNPYAAQRAMWILDGIGELSSADVQQGMKSAHPKVRQHAVQLASRFLDRPAIVEHLLQHAADDDAAVRFECALVLGDAHSEKISKVLADIAMRHPFDDWTLTAILTSSSHRSAAILDSMFVSSPATSGASNPSNIQLVRELASVVGVCGDRTELDILLRTIGNLDRPGIWWRTSALCGLATGLSRHQGELGRITLRQLLTDPPTALAGSVEPVSQWLELVSEVARDAAAPLGDRISAIELLGHRPLNQAEQVMEELFSSSQPIEIQSASLSSLQQANWELGAELVFDRWSALGPRLRAEALTFLLRRKETVLQALEAMVAGTFDSAVVNVDQRAILLAHPDAAIQKLSQDVFGRGVSTDRQAVAMKYRPALSLAGSPEAGQQIFDKACASCHRFRGRGHNVGPDISDTRNRSREALLYDILDPNQKLEPQYTAYQVLTNDGQVFQGLMVSETANSIVLKLAESEQRQIAREDIEHLRAHGKSLMPEGIEDTISIQQMADLIEYLKSF